MFGSPSNPVEMSTKLNRILGQLAIINNRIDSHDKGIARTEKFHSSEDDGDIAKDVSGPNWRTRDTGSGHGNNTDRDRVYHRDRNYFFTNAAHTSITVTPRL
jgi:hypothetical protein